MRKTLAALLIAVSLTPTVALAQTQPTNETRGIMYAVRQQPPKERSWPGRHPVLFGALVGLGVGVGVEAAVIPGARGGEPHSVYLPMFGAAGAGIGSLVGLIVSAARR